MAKTQENPWFSGITAISDAGGIDGFVREVLAESKRIAMKNARHSKPSPVQARSIEIMFQEVVSAVMFARLNPDFDRGFRRLVGREIAEDTEGSMDAAFERAFGKAQRWSRAVAYAAMDAIQPRLREVLDQIIDGVTQNA